MAPILLSLSLSLSPQDPDPALDPYFTANALYNRGLYELAADEFKAFLKKHPRHAKARDARFGLGLCLHEMGKHGEAEPILSRLSADATFAHRLRARTVHAECLLALGKEKEAERAFGEALKQAPDDAHRRAALSGLVETQYLRARWKELVQSGERLLKLGGVAEDRLTYQIAEARLEMGDAAKAVTALEAWQKNHKTSPLAAHARFMLAESRLQASDLRKAGREFQAIARKPEDPFAATALFRLGYVRFLEGRVDESIRELEQFLAKYPKDESRSPALLFLGRAHLEKGRHDEAVRQLELAGKDGALQVEAALWIARARAAQGRHEQAEKTAAEHAGKKGPLRAELCEEVGRARLAQGKFAPAGESFAKAVEADPEGPFSAEGRWLAAHAYHRAEQNAESLKWCRAFSERHGDHPRSGDVSFIAAENLFLSGKLKEAEAALAEYLKRHPKHDRSTAARFRTGQVAYRRGDWKRALSFLQPISQRPPKEPLFESAGFLVGECQFRLGAWSEAADAYRNFTRKSPKAPHVDTARLRMALAQVRTGDRDGAMRSLEELIRLHPKSTHRATAYGELGRLRFEAKDYSRARAALREAIKAGETLEAPYTLGWVALAEKKPEEAIEAFGRVAREHPKEVLAADAALQYGTLQVRKGEYAEARVSLERAIETHPGFEKIDRLLYTLGLCLSRLKEWDGAIQRFQSLAKDHPKSPSRPAALYEWAWCEREAGRAEKARTRYSDFLSTYPKDSLAPEVTVELAELELEAGEPAAARKRLDALVAAGVRKDLRPRVLYRLGRCQAAEKDVKTAARTFEAVLIGDPDSEFAARASYQAGEARLRLKEYDAAYLHFLKAKGPRALLRRSECEALTGRWKESEASCKAFLDRHPGDPLAARARFGLGWARENQRRHEEALEAYREVTAAGGKDETSARSQFQIGECLFALKRYDEAIKALIKVEVNYGYAQWRSRALLEIGRVLEAQDRKGEAAARYREVLRKYGDLEAAAVARQLLDKISSKRGDP